MMDGEGHVHSVGGVVEIVGGLDGEGGECAVGECEC